MLAQVRFLLEMFLNILNAILDLMPMIDMDMTEMAVLALCSLIFLDHRMEKFFHAFPCREHGGAHRYAKQLRQFIQIDVVTSFLSLIKHVESNHHTHMHINQLRSQIEVPLQVGGVYHINDNIRSMLDQLLPNIQFLRRVSRQGISAWQVDQVELIPFILSMPLLSIHGHSGIVTHSFMGTTSEIEQGRLATVRITDKSHIDHLAPLHGSIFHLFIGQGTVIDVVWGICSICLQCLMGSLLPFHGPCLRLTEHFDHLRLTMAETDLISHNLIFDRVL